MTNEPSAPSTHAADDESQTVVGSQTVNESQTPDEPIGDNGASDDHTPERKLRRRAQAAETERDELRTSLEAVQRHEVARLVAGRLADFSDLFTYGELTVADLADATGMIDAATVFQAVDALLDRRPGLAAAELKRPTPGTYAQSGQFAATPRTKSSTGGWGAVKLR